MVLSSSQCPGWKRFLGVQIHTWSLKVACLGSDSRPGHTHDGDGAFISLPEKRGNEYLRHFKILPKILDATYTKVKHWSDETTPQLSVGHGPWWTFQRHRETSSWKPRVWYFYTTVLWTPNLWTLQVSFSSDPLPEETQTSPPGTPGYAKVYPSQCFCVSRKRLNSLFKFLLEGTYSLPLSTPSRNSWTVLLGKPF